MAPSRAVTIVLNARAGSAGGHSSAIADAFAAAGLRAEILPTAGGEIERVAGRVARSRGCVIVAGGDGTVSSAASIALGAGVPLGVVPLGSRNHFARDAGVPLDFQGAARAIAAGTPTAVDVGEVNGRPFLNNASIGIYPRLVWEREIERCRGRRKWVAMAIGIARTWQRYRKVTVHTTIDGVEHVRRTPFVLVGNGRYEAEGPWLGRRPSLDSGVLSAYVAPAASRWELLALPLCAIFGRLTPAVRLETFLAGDLSIETSRKRVTIAIDGELLTARAPLRTTIRPRALQVLTPQPG